MLLDIDVLKKTLHWVASQNKDQLSTSITLAKNVRKFPSTILQSPFNSEEDESEVLLESVFETEQKIHQMKQKLIEATQLALQMDEIICCT